MKFNVNDGNMFLNVFILGLITALETEQLSPEECEVLLFNPYIVQKCKENRINKPIINIIEKCTELDDIKRIVPYDYERTIAEIKKECLSYLQLHEKLEYPINRYFE